MSWTWGWEGRDNKWGLKSWWEWWPVKKWLRKFLRWVSLSSSVQTLSMTGWQIPSPGCCTAVVQPVSWALTLAMMAAEARVAGETKRKKMGNTQCVCKEKKPKESFDLKLLWVSLYLACSCSLEDFWRSSRIQPWWKPPSDFQATSPVGLSVCGERSGSGAGTAVSLTAWTGS